MSVLESIASPPLSSPTSRATSRVHLLGMPIDVLTQAETVRVLTERLNRREGTWVLTPNLDILRHYHRTAELRALFEQADLLLADGMPLIWASRIARLNGTGLPERVPGSGLAVQLAAAAAENGWRMFLLGGNPGAAESAASVLRTQHSALQIVGTDCPPLGFEKDPDEFARLEQKLLAAAPDLVYVALGFPKQEYVIQRLRKLLPHATFIGVGITLSFIAGTVQRAPGWVQRVGLEWVHRMVQEPKRLAKRYLLHDLPFAVFTLFPHALSVRSKRALRGDAPKPQESKSTLFSQPSSPVQKELP